MDMSINNQSRSRAAQKNQQRVASVRKQCTKHLDAHGHINTTKRSRKDIDQNNTIWTTNSDPGKAAIIM